MSKSLSLVVLDADESWIDSLFRAMPALVRERLVRIENADTILRRNRSVAERRGGLTETRTVFVPGLRRVTALSQHLVTRALRGLADAEPIDVLVCTNPWHAPAFEATRAALKIYYVTDPFDHYAWPQARTLELENRVLAASDIVVSTSIQLADDFRGRTSARVVHLPNAVSSSFVEELQQPLPRPLSLAAIDGPIVGVVGQMNDTYDWDLIDGLSQGLPDVSFVLVGPVMRRETSWERFQELTERPNVLWVGRQPHSMLPAFLAAFDVCLNPLRKDDRNDRRCPLRLFDYSATMAPIVSTPIREVDYFGDQIDLIEDGESGATLIRDLLASGPGRHGDRAAWAQQNTWEARAEQWLALIEEHLPSLDRGGSDAGARQRHFPAPDHQRT